MRRRVEHTLVGATALRAAALRATALLAAGLAAPIAAQDADAPRAPRIIGTPAPPAAEETRPASATERPPLVNLPLRVSGLRPPSAARLAPLPEERTDDLEEIVIVGQGWRLPDLGSEWRERQAEIARSGRFSATALPLYDPGRPAVRDAGFLASREQRRHGYIELFRLRFGRRSRD
jgi:hypothetical protein